MKRLLAIVLVLCMVALTLMACSPENDSQTSDSDGQIVIGWTCSHIAGNEMYTIVTAEMQRLAEEAGAQFIADDAQMDITAQISAMENFIAQGVDAIIIDAINAEALDPIIIQAQEAGIKIIASGTELLTFDAWGLVDQVLSGEIAAIEAVRFIDERHGGAAQIGYLTSESNINVAEREIGFDNILREQSPDSEVLSRLTAVSREEGVTQAENMMQANPEIRVILAGSEDAALGAMEAIIGMGFASEDFGIFTINGSSPAIQLVSEDTILRTTVRFELERIPSMMIDATLALVRGEDVPRYLPVSPLAITIENAQDFLE